MLDRVEDARGPGNGRPACRADPPLAMRVTLFSEPQLLTPHFCG